MQTKIISILSLIILVLIFISQNTGVTQLNFLFWTFEMSAILLFSFILLIGIILGLIISKLFDRTVVKNNVPTEKE
jgi:uncharacterized integral membrane protein